MDPTFAFDPNVNTTYLSARSWRAPRRDPLVLDLDADGIETTALSTTSPILFDLNADGVKTGTGWIKPDDGLLVLDRNGNGLIDDGRELFGDATPLAAGGTAHDGLAALADLDTNRDGRIDAADARFAQLRVWRDLNQDGVSQSNELASLASLGIQSIDLTRTANTTNLANGNQIADQASFLKTDDTTGGIGSLADVNLAGNPFYSHFTERLDTSTVAGLPDMQGAGMVRDLKEAASLSGGLAGTLAAYAGATTREQQMALLDGLLAAWADTSTMDTSIEQAATNGMKLIYLAPGETIQDAVQIDNMAGEPGELSPAEFARRRELQARQEHLTGLIGLLEKFNGQTFVTVNRKPVTDRTDGRIYRRRAGSSRSATSTPSCAANWHRMRSDGLPTPRSICDTKVRSMSASSASRSWERPASARRARRLVARVARSFSKSLVAMPVRMAGHGLMIHGI